MALPLPKLDKSHILFHNYYQMGRYSEMKNREIIENKPYLSKKELSLLLEKKGKNLDKKISQLLRKDYLVPLKKGLYTTNIYILKTRENLSEYLANILYFPSYLSLEYVLQKEGLIPEAVYVYTSVTLKVPRAFENKLGRFSYRKIKDSLFSGYQQVPFRENYLIKIARKAKALFDYLYLKPLSNRVKQEPLSDLRINWDNFSKEDFGEFSSYVDIYSSNKMRKIRKVLKEELKW